MAVVGAWKLTCKIMAKRMPFESLNHLEDVNKQGEMNETCSSCPEKNICDGAWKALRSEHDV